MLVSKNNWDSEFISRSLNTTEHKLSSDNVNQPSIAEFDMNKIMRKQEESNFSKLSDLESVKSEVYATEKEESKIVINAYSVVLNNLYSGFDG